MTTTYRTIYPKKFIDAATLTGHTVEVAIEEAAVEEFYSPFTKRKSDKIVLAFHAKTARLPLNMTQAETLATITGTDDYTAWIGHTIRLTTGTAPNRKQTIVILPPLAQPSPATDRDQRRTPSLATFCAST